MAPSNRKFRNYLLQPSLQLKLGLATLVLTTVFSFIFITILFASLRRLFETVLELTDIRDTIMISIQESLANTAMWLVLVVAIYAFANLSLSVFFTHRLVGPTVAFRRHIQALMDGLYNSRITLRKDDAFIEVADDLNRLAEHLETKG